MEHIPHPGDVERHIMRDLGFQVGPAGDEMIGSGLVVPEMCVPGTSAIRTSILAAWADVVAGYLAIDLFTPGVPVTLDLDVHLRRRPDCGAIRMAGRVQKSGRSVSVLSIGITDGGGADLGFAHATFMAAPNPSLRMPTVVRDDGMLRPHPPKLEAPFAERARCERTGAGTATLPLLPDGLNASATLNGGLIALVAEEAVLSASPAGTTLASMSMRYVQPVRVGPALATAAVAGGLGEVVVVDHGRDDKLAVIATTRAFAPGELVRPPAPRSVPSTP